MSDASTEIIIKSLKILARDIQSDDGVANLALLEAADCLKRIVRERDEALSQIFQAECRAERFCQERDEARKEAEYYKERYEQIKDERDEARAERDLARKEIDRYREKHDLLPISWDV